MMKHGGRFLSPCSFLAKQLKSTDHTDDTDFLRWCSGKGHTEINHRNLDGLLAKLSYKVVCFTLPSAAAPRCATLQ